MVFKEKNSNRYLFWARVFNPVFLIAYSVFCFYSYSLAQYGGIKRRLPVVIGCFIILLIWFLWCIFSERKAKKAEQNIHETIDDKAIQRRKYWCLFACLFLIVTTTVTGVKIYESSIDFNGKLSWYLRDLKNKREIKFVENNIYEHGIQGIFNAINSKIELPDELYLSSESDFRLKFQRNGTILIFDTYLYGKNGEGETESFLISYNRRRSDEIVVYLNGYVNDRYDEEHRFRPFMDTIEKLSLENTVSEWQGSEFGILYAGFRNWGYNTDGIRTIDKEGNIGEVRALYLEIVGYTTSVYVPNDDSITPMRYIAEWERTIPKKVEVEKNDTIGYVLVDDEEAFFISEDKGYRLSVVDAALGSRFYALDTTEDGGLTWETLNPDPFVGDTGVSAGITFLDDNLGFIAMSHSGGSYAELYRTEDGGLSYEKIVLPEIEVSLNETETYNPFDFPDMPYREDGELFLKVGQGQDGDYKGGVQALLQSADEGLTWEYVR